MDIREYYDPRNSALNEVFDRRLGLPVAGVSFPGRLLLDAQDREEVAELLRRLLAAVHGLN